MKFFATFFLVLGLNLTMEGQNAKHVLNAQTDSVSAHHQHAVSQGFNFTPEFENDSIQVFRIKIGPHEKLPMHALTPRVVVLLTNENLKLTFPNGDTREEHHLAGETMWVAGGRHSGENLSDKPIEFIAVIPKQK